MSTKSLGMTDICQGIYQNYRRKLSPQSPLTVDNYRRDISEYTNQRSRVSPKYVKCPKKDSVMKVSLESDSLFSVEI